MSRNKPVAGPVGPVRSLQELVDAEPRGFLPVRLSFPAVDGVVLRHEGWFADAVVETGEVRSVYMGDPARLITDPVREVELMRHAASWLARQVTQVQQEQQEASQRHSEFLQAIGRYAIEKRREDAICQDGLNAFLRTFDMAPDHTVVRFTITGTYTVAHGNSEAAESDGGSFMDARPCSLVKVMSYRVEW